MALGVEGDWFVLDVGVGGFGAVLGRMGTGICYQRPV